MTKPLVRSDDAPFAGTEGSAHALQVQMDAQPLTLTFTLTHRVSAGACLRLRADGVVSMRAIESLQVTANGQALAIVQRYAPDLMQREWNWFIRHLAVATVAVEAELPAGTPILVEAVMRGFAEPRAPEGKRCGPLQAATPYAGIAWSYRLLAGPAVDAEPSHWEPVAGVEALVLTPGTCATLEAYQRPGGRLAVRYLDAFTNPVAPDVAELQVGDCPVRLEPAPRATALTLPSSSAGRVQVRDARGRQALSSARPVGIGGSPLYFGEFHWHCDISGDGQRPLADALTSARDELCLDFAGPSDHLGYGISYGAKTIHDQRAICEAFDAPGQFVTLPTFERSEREGHANVIADSWEILLDVAGRIDRSRFPPNRFPLEALAAVCPQGRAILVPHHTNLDSFAREGVMREDDRPYWCRFDWGDVAERKATRLVEIHQARGSFEDEMPDPLWRIDVGGFGSSVRTALARGFRLGFTGGTDNHSGWPARLGGSWCGLTGVHAETLTVADLFQALHARRCYATTGARIVADMTLNGYPMGSEVALAPGEARTLQIKLHGTAPLAAVQVISCGAVLADLPVPADCVDLELTWTDDRPGRPLRDCYYYVRARQVDGHCAWLSPIWIDLI